MVANRLVAGLLATLLGLTACSAGPGGPDHLSSPGSSTAAPARQLDEAEVSAAVEDYIARGSATLANVRAVVVSVDGVTQVAHYRDGAASDRVHVFSVTKSVLSTLVGIALDEGLLPGLEADLRVLLPAYEDRMSDRTASITLEQLLTMTSGIPSNTYDVDPRLERPDWVSEVLRTGTSEPPGAVWQYSDPAADLLAAVLTAALDRRDGRRPHALVDYARSRLLDPLGIGSRPAYTGFEGNEPWSARFYENDFGWATDHRGRCYGSSMLKLTAADMLALGELYRQGGRWNGRQVVPAAWVSAATTPVAQQPQYGRMWWIGTVGVHPAFYADGRGGQLVVVVPDLALVVAVQSRFDVEGKTNDLTRGQDLLPMVDEVVASRLT